MTDSFAGNVIRVDNATGLVTPLAVGPGPSGIAVGVDGVWVADRGADKLVRIDPNTRAVTATIGVGRSPTGVSVGAGSVWVANSGDGTVTRIDPATNKTIATIACRRQSTSNQRRRRPRLGNGRRHSLGAGRPRQRGWHPHTTPRRHWPHGPGRLV